MPQDGPRLFRVSAARFGWQGRPGVGDPVWARRAGAAAAACDPGGADAGTVRDRGTGGSPARPAAVPETESRALGTTSIPEPLATVTANHDDTLVPLNGHTVGGYREYAPPPGLEALASVMWTHCAPDHGAAGAPHRVVPEPDVSLCYISRRVASGDSVPVGLVLIGPVRGARFYDPPPGTKRRRSRTASPTWPASTATATATPSSRP